MTMRHIFSLVFFIISFNGFGQHTVAIQTNVPHSELYRCETKDGTTLNIFELLATANSEGNINWNAEKFSKKWRSLCVCAEHFEKHYLELEKEDSQSFNVVLYHENNYLVQSETELLTNPTAENYSAFLKDCFDHPKWEELYQQYLKTRASKGSTELNAAMNLAQSTDDIIDALVNLKSELALPINEFPSGNAPIHYTSINPALSVLINQLEDWDGLGELDLDFNNEYIPKSTLKQVVRAALTVKIRTNNSAYILSLLNQASSVVAPSWMSYGSAAEFRELVTTTLMEIANSLRMNPDYDNLENLIGLTDAVYLVGTADDSDYRNATSTVNDWSSSTMKAWHEMHALYWNPYRKNTNSIQNSYNELKEEFNLIASRSNASQASIDSPWHPYASIEFITAWWKFIEDNPLKADSKAQVVSSVIHHIESGAASFSDIQRMELAMLGPDGGLVDSLVSWVGDERMNPIHSITIPCPQLLAMLPSELSPIMSSNHVPLWQLIMPDSISTKDFHLTLDSSTCPIYHFEDLYSLYTNETNCQEAEGDTVRTWALYGMNDELLLQSMAIPDTADPSSWLTHVGIPMAQENGVPKFRALMDLQTGMDSIDARNGLKLTSPVSGLNRESEQAVASLMGDLEHLESEFISTNTLNDALACLPVPLSESEFTVIKTRLNAMEKKAALIRSAIATEEAKAEAEREKQRKKDMALESKFHNRTFQHGYEYIRFYDSGKYVLCTKITEDDYCSCKGEGSWRVESGQMILSANDCRINGCGHNRKIYGSATNTVAGKSFELNGDNFNYNYRVTSLW